MKLANSYNCARALVTLSGRCWSFRGVSSRFSWGFHSHGGTRARWFIVEKASMDELPQFSGLSLAVSIPSWFVGTGHKKGRLRSLLSGFSFLRGKVIRCDWGLCDMYSIHGYIYTHYTYIYTKKYIFLILWLLKSGSSRRRGNNAHRARQSLPVANQLHRLHCCFYAE